MADANYTLSMWKRLSPRPGGRWLFSRLVCWKAPYFASIRPLFLELAPGRCRVRVRRRRAVENHLGTVHAIAMCNMAELAGGTMVEATLPKTHRWIPKGMTVEYLSPARDDVLAEATLRLPDPLPEAADVPVSVEVTCDGDPVCRGTITMWVSRRKPAG